MYAKGFYLAGAIGAGVIGLVLAGYPAAAQDYAPYVTPGFSYSQDTPEVVVVRPPYSPTQRDSATGAPIENVSLSRPVRFDDLDLTSNWGVRALHTRIRIAAQTLCSQLDAMYPAAVDTNGPNSPVDMSCYRRAVDDAMYQADAAVAAAREERP